MATAVVTDGKYRTSIAAVRALGRAGYQVVVTQTRGDSALEPPVFASRYVSESRWLDGSAADPDYPDKLYELLAEYDHPVLFCAGAATLNAVAKQRERFAQVCGFLIASPEALDALNDKETVHRRCEELGIPVPKQYEGEPEGWPVIIKPHCGEKFGLKAKDRYAIANNAEEYAAKRAAMVKYDPNPIVQQKVEGTGAGASLLLDREGRLISAICHRRIREYPAAGGPSTCCESFYDEHMIDSAYRLLSSFGFVGMAMVEFKGEYVLEVNPRVWGSFPMTERASSPFVSRYARAAAGERLEYVPQDYQTGARMRFTLNDGAAMLDYLRHGRPGPFFQGMADWFRARDALSAKDDPKPLRRYVRGMLLKR
ncbi:MAG: ATP-grasp domain-containing protein [Clostridiales bacterium]|nr:ATP-grasp domain-containing protein [Clostridiales bacterium]